MSQWSDSERRVFEVARSDCFERRPRGGKVRPPLAEQGAGVEAGSVFEVAREEAKIASEWQRIRDLVRKPPPRPRYEEQGSVRIPQSVFTGLDRGGKKPLYQVQTLGLLVLLLLSFENAASLTVRGYVEGSGDDLVLVIDARYGLGERFGSLPDWKRRLTHLEKLGWFNVEWSGQLVRISRGPRALTALRGAA